MFRFIHLPNTYVRFEYTVVQQDGSLGSLTIRLHTRD